MAANAMGLASVDRWRRVGAQKVLFVGDRPHMIGITADGSDATARVEEVIQFLAHRDVPAVLPLPGQDVRAKLSALLALNPVAVDAPVPAAGLGANPDVTAPAIGAALDLALKPFLQAPAPAGGHSRLVNRHVLKQRTEAAQALGVSST
jgi:hypothetical protein